MNKSSIEITFIVLGAIFLGVYLALISLVYSPVYPALALRPSPLPGNLEKAKSSLQVFPEECFFNSGGEKLHGWLFTKPGSKVVVLVHHGNAGNILNRTYLSEEFLRLGASAFIYDYRGFGMSTGTPTLQGLLDDGVNAFDFVQTKCKGLLIINYGESIGTAVACHADHLRKSDGLILQSAIVSLPAAVKDVFPFFVLYPEFIWPNPHLNNCDLLAQSNTPLLLIHGERDTLVPCDRSARLFACAHANQKQFVRLPNCGHNDVGAYDHDLFSKAIGNYLRERQSAPAVSK